MVSCPSCVGEDFRFLVQAAYAEDGRLGLVDDGGAELLAEDARRW